MMRRAAVKQTTREGGGDGRLHTTQQRYCQVITLRLITDRWTYKQLPRPCRDQYSTTNQSACVFLTRIFLPGICLSVCLSAYLFSRMTHKVVLMNFLLKGYGV